MDGSAPGAPAAPAISTGARGRVRINLALQGGGTHGAFTWGACERLLEDERVEIDAISGCSAGAINGAMLAQGIAEGGRQGGIAAMAALWADIAAKLTMSPLRNNAMERAIWGHDLSHGWAWQAFDVLTRHFSPYQLNPFPVEWNPLRRALELHFRRESLALDRAPKFFVSATSVRTGKPRVFTREEVSIDTLLASACLPHFFKAVEVDGEPFWDGGYLGNPALWPLYEQGAPPDIVLVQITPLVREELPRTTDDIVNRLTEIGFNASLMYEMRAIDFVQRLLDQGVLTEPRYRRLFVHVIEDEERMRRFKLSTKFNGDWDFLKTLKDWGRAAADRWLAENFDRLGVESTVDIRARYLS